MKKLIFAVTLMMLCWIPVYGQLDIFQPHQGGTGIGSVTAGDIGLCLKVLTNSPFSYQLASCGSGGGGGTDGNWVFFNNSGIRLATTTNQVLIGRSATTTTSALEVSGTATANNFTATTTATSTLPTLYVTGRLYDGLGTGGINGYVLQTTGTGISWVATSSLGISGSGSGTVGAGTTGQYPYYATNGTTLTATSTLFLATTGNIGIGTTSPYAKLTVDTGITPANTIAYFPSNLDNFTQVLTQNSSTGVNASAGYTACNDLDPQNTGCPNNYVEFGMDGSNFNLTPLGAGTGFLISSSTKDFQFTNINTAASWEFFTQGNPGTSRLKILNTGNIGIGTSTPSSKLTVQATAQQSALNIASSTPTAESMLKVAANGYVGIGTSTPASLLAIDGNGSQTADGYLFTMNEASGRDSGMVFGRALRNGFGLKMNTGAFDYLCFQVNGATLPTFTEACKTVMTDTGKVGVGTTTPYSKLTVWGNGTGTEEAFEVSDSASTTNMRIWDNGTTYFRGNVGVGTTSPYAALSVVGSSGVVAAKFTATSTTATSTFAGDVVISGTNTGTSTQYIYSKTAGFGGQIINEDEGGGTCTRITTKAGVAITAVITCPTEI